LKSLYLWEHAKKKSVLEWLTMSRTWQDTQQGRGPDVHYYLHLLWLYPSLENNPAGRKQPGNDLPWTVQTKKAFEAYENPLIKIFEEIGARRGACVADQYTMGAAFGELRTTRSCKPLNNFCYASLLEPQRHTK
jgi:hypothetical protein